MRLTASGPARGGTTVTQVNAQHCERDIRSAGGDVRIVQLGAVGDSVPDFPALPRIVRWFPRIG